MSRLRTLGRWIVSGLATDNGWAWVWFGYYPYSVHTAWRSTPS